MPSFADIFARNADTLSSDQQQLLQTKAVAIIGCGGLGGYVIEQLARIGVGRLHLFDPDVFTPSNCNRQLNALQSTLGQSKAEVAARRIRDIHPFCAVRSFAADFRTVSEDEAFAVDVAVDCLYDIQARRDLSVLCNRRAIPLVHGAVSGWFGQIGVQLPGGDLIGQLYPKRLAAGAPPSVLACTVATIASLQAVETVKLLLDLWSPLHNTWMHADLKDGDFLINEP